MRTTAISLNPFSLMMEPEMVLQAMERSPSLRGLNHRKLRPLDRPLIPFKLIAADASAPARDAFDDTDLQLDD